jgi:putative DNA primase/helicase
MSEEITSTDISEDYRCVTCDVPYPCEAHPSAPAEPAGPSVVDPPGEPLPNARRYVDATFHHEIHTRLVHHGGGFFAWNGTCWPELEDAALRTGLYRFFEDATYLHVTKTGEEHRPFAPNRYKIGDLLDALRAVVHVDGHLTAPAWLNDDGPVPADEVVACDNGLIHVPTRTLLELTPSFYVHHAVPFGFDPDAPAPSRWLTFLNELWPDDRESIDTLQEIFGLLASGDTRMQKIFLLVGPKRGGKGTIARVLKAMIGAHHVAGPTLSGLATNFGLSPLIGKPVAIVSDARIRSGGTDIVTERLLSISGEDTLTIDRKFRDPWTGQLPTRFVILSNELPRLTDTSGALASRFVVLTLTRSFYGRENPDLTAELLAELPSIFNWSLDGLERLRARGRFSVPQSSKDAIRELEDLGSPVGAFLRDECIRGPEVSTPVDAIYAAWKAWCQDHGRDHPGTQQTFGRDLRAAVPGLKVTQPRGPDGRQHRHYQGIRVCDHGRDEHGVPCEHGRGDPDDEEPGDPSTEHSASVRVSPRVTDADESLTRDDTRTTPMQSVLTSAPRCEVCSRILGVPGTCRECLAEREEGAA